MINRIGPDLRPYAERAAKIFFDLHPDFLREGPSDDRIARESIQRIAVDLRLTAEGAVRELQIKQRSRPEYVLDNLIRSDKALEQIRPEIESLRLEVFGQKKAPFKSYDTALRWIKREWNVERKAFFKRLGIKIIRKSGKTIVEGYRNQLERIQKIDDRIDDLIRKRNDLAESRRPVSACDLEVLFPLPAVVRLRPTIVKNKDGTTTMHERFRIPGFRTYPGTNLRKMADTIKSLAAMSRFREEGIALYILTGDKPIQKVMDLTFYGPVSNKSLISFLRQRVPLFKRPRRLSTSGLEVLEFIKARGGVPKKEIMKFWTDAGKAWNKTHPKKQYASFEGLKRAYERTTEKIGRI